MTCLKTSLASIEDEQCKAEVVRVAGVQAEHWEASTAVASKCANDKERFCAHKTEGGVQEW